MDETPIRREENNAKERDYLRGEGAQRYAGVGGCALPGLQRQIRIYLSRERQT